MEFFFSLNNEKVGPFSQIKAKELVDEGEITESTLAWHRGLDEWMPAVEISALKDLFDRKTDPHPDEAPKNEPTVSDAPTLSEPPSLPEARKEPTDTLPQAIHPFRRLFARLYDLLLISVIIYSVSGITFPQAVPGESINDFLNKLAEYQRSPEAATFTRTYLIGIVLWQLIEGLLIHLFGATPGKALFGIRVEREDGGLLTIPYAIARSFFAFILGAGFFQFPFMLICGIFSFLRLKSHRKCLWDQHLHSRVVTKTLAPSRIMLAIAAFLALIMLLQSVKFT